MKQLYNLKCNAWIKMKDFFLLPQCSQRSFAAEASESVCMWERVKVCYRRALHIWIFFHFFCNLQDSFSTVWLSLIKTTVMMIGEFDYDSIYTDGIVNYKFISYLMFCVFMVIMSIIIMNLLVSNITNNTFMFRVFNVFMGIYIMHLLVNIIINNIFVFCVIMVFMGHH